MMKIATLSPFIYSNQILRGEAGLYRAVMGPRGANRGYAGLCVVRPCSTGFQRSTAGTNRSYAGIIRTSAASQSGMCVTMPAYVGLIRGLAWNGGVSIQTRYNPELPRIPPACPRQYPRGHARWRHSYGEATQTPGKAPI